MAIANTKMWSRFMKGSSSASHSMSTGQNQTINGHDFPLGRMKAGSDVSFLVNPYETYWTSESLFFWWYPAGTMKNDPSGDQASLLEKENISLSSMNIQ